MKAVPSIQPIKASSTGRVEAVEVLARWRWQGKVIAPPAYPGAINWARTDFEVASGILAATDGRKFGWKKIFLNVSEATLIDDELFYRWLAVVQQILAGGVTVGVEIVESIPDEVLKKAWDLLQSIQVELVMDDFGYGFSNMNRLQGYPWNYCKFDVRRYGTTLWNTHDKAAILYCKQKQIAGIAECVESIKDSLHARWTGMNLQQGYLYGAPVLIEEEPRVWQLV